LPVISFNNGIVYALKKAANLLKPKKIHINEEDLIIHLYSHITPTDDFPEENPECG